MVTLFDTTDKNIFKYVIVSDGDVDTVVKSSENNVSHIEVKQNGQTIIHATLPVNIPNAPVSAMSRPIHVTGVPMLPSLTIEEELPVNSAIKLL